MRPRGKDGKPLTQPLQRAGDTLLPGAETSLFLRPVTLDRWTVVVDQRGTIASIRRAVNPQTDAQEVLEIVAALPK